MTQKWNLQDIRPAKPRQRKKVPRSLETIDKEQTQPAPAPVARDEIPSIVIEDGSKKGVNRLIISVVLFVVIVGIQNVIIVSSKDKII